MKYEKGKRPPGIMIYDDILQTLTAMPGDKLKILLEAMVNYHLREEAPVLDESLQLLWPLIRSHLDHDAQRYEENCVQKRINGLIGSFKKNYAPDHGISPQDMDAMGEYLLSKGITEELIIQGTGISISQRPLAGGSRFSQYQSQ